MPQQKALRESPVEVLGKIDIAGSPALVSWPYAGDAVGIDFVDRPGRFGVVVALDSDPRLRVEPSHADVLDVEGRVVVLEQVGALWYRVGVNSAALRRGRAAS